ncbi:MAG: HypC/HybG/HupF family hydrogenase formation chaperone [Rhodocyclaceae bacterium]|jgi:hydrogenase expression/formation protein HypC|nr:HypC/HybG/HupF family hydrogenase formation chaperone [Rhodocyclaceae bacterium]
MCLAIPSRIVESDGLRARVECFGQEREVNLMLMPEEVAVGDYVLVQVGGFAYERVEQSRALEALALMEEVIGLGEPEAAT